MTLTLEPRDRAVNRDYHRWYSPSLDRDMELLVFGHAGERVLVFPTRTGRFYDYEDWGLVEAARRRIEAGELQLYCLDSIDAESFYCPWRSPADRIRRHEAYERYILQEVVPLTSLMNPNQTLTAHGCSMGAYHAVNIALRHPYLFSRVVALSGRYDLTTPTGPFRDLLDGYYDLGVYFHTPAHFLPNLTDEGLLHPLRRASVTLAIGEADPFLGSNHHLSSSLWNKEVRHDLHIWSGRSHKPNAWRPMVGLYL